MAILADHAAPSIFPELHRLGRFGGVRAVGAVDGGGPDAEEHVVEALVWPSAAGDAADESEAVAYVFRLRRNTVGRTAGCLLVAQVSRAPGA